MTLTQALSNLRVPTAAVAATLLSAADGLTNGRNLRGECRHRHLTGGTASQKITSNGISFNNIASPGGHLDLQDALA